MRAVGELRDAALKKRARRSDVAVGHVVGEHVLADKHAAVPAYDGTCEQLCLRTLGKCRTPLQSNRGGGPRTLLVLTRQLL